MTPIVLIGPMSAGKSSVAEKLAERLDLPNVPMDRVRWYYYLKNGFSIVHESSLETFKDRVAYWKPFEVKAVKSIVTEFSNAVIDFGAGHSFYTDEKQFAEVSEFLSPIQNIFLLLPSEDKEESLRICNSRLASKFGRELENDEIESNKEFIYHPSNYRLAKQIVYNKGESPEQTAHKIADLLE